MRPSAATCLALVTFLLPGTAVRAEMAVTIEHNDAASATGDFRFQTVPSPRPSAAGNATFSLVDGARDGNGGDLDVLHDGEVPDEADQPESNFFFQGGHGGGRLLVDLGKVIPVKEVNTYSWHSDTRAPQLYQLYGSNGTDAGFIAQPHRPQDPAQNGWTLIASVDTRSKDGKPGGQYGVSVADAAGLVGNYRYLLFDVASTGSDAFADTFYSEIDVIDRDAPISSAPARKAKEHLTYNQKGIQLTFTNDDPTFDPKERDRLVETFFTVYPEMMAAFNRDAPRTVRLSVERKYKGVAATAGNTIHVNPNWFHHNPEDLDVITHEGMHVVQQYRQWNPGWLVEGIADYARHKFGVNNAVAKWSLPDYEAKQNYDNAYRITARFLVWLEARVKPGIVTTLDRSMRDGTYSPETWTQQTGKSVEALWQDYGKNPTL